jgi:tetratricopeptide (TPR) repeat protein
MRAARLTSVLACLCAGVAAFGWMPAAMAQSGDKAQHQLSPEELNEKYHFCTFPVSNIHFSVQHVNDVIAACTVLINTEGGSAENRSLIYLQRGAMYRRLGKFKLALADFTMSIHYDPKSAYAYTGRGNAHRGLHQLDEAIADHTEAIRLDPNYAIAYSNRGNAWDDKKEYKRAIEDFDAALKLNPRYSAALNNRAIAKSNLGDHGGAIADYSAAIKLDPRDAIAYFNRGNERLEAGDKKGAIADYRAALKIDPRLTQAAEALKEIAAEEPKTKRRRR